VEILIEDIRKETTHPAEAIESPYNELRAFWENSKSCIRLDEDAEELGRPTPRKSSFVPELQPPW
jgi:hypothetical protein